MGGVGVVEVEVGAIGIVVGEVRVAGVVDGIVAMDGGVAGIVVMERCAGRVGAMGRGVGGMVAMERFITRMTVERCVAWRIIVKEWRVVMEMPASRVLIMISYWGGSVSFPSLGSKIKIKIIKRGEGNEGRRKRKDEGGQRTLRET